MCFKLFYLLFYNNCLIKPIVYLIFLLNFAEFDISLCGHELKAGMGFIAAAEVFEAHRISAEEFRVSAPSITKNKNLVVKFRESYLPWEKAAPLVLGVAAFDLDLPVAPEDTIPVGQDDRLKSSVDNPGPSSSGRRWRLWPLAFRKVKTAEHNSGDESSEDIFLDSESDLFGSEPSPTSGRLESPRKQFVRTNVPSNEMIASLNLKDGQNMVTFSFSTRVLGTQQVWHSLRIQVPISLYILWLASLLISV